MNKEHDKGHKGQMSDREAMKLALEALLIWEEMHPRTTASAVRSPAIQALQEALEQPDDAAWAKHLKEPMSEKRVHESDTMERECNPHPDAPHGFNRDASHGLGRYVCDCEGWEPEPWDTTDMGIDRGAWDDVPDATKWVDELRGGDETEQEPVAWLATNNERGGISCLVFKYSEAVQFGDQIESLYTSPPKREWVGLTDEDIAEGAKQSWVDKQAFESAVWWAEEKLKEKNGG